MTADRRFKAVLFDLDGTLVDSVADICDALNQTFAALGYSPIQSQQVSRWIGNGSMVLIERALQSLRTPITPSQHHRAHELFLQYYDACSHSGSSLYEGVYDTLLALHNQSLPMAIITNKPSQFLPALLDELCLSQFFSCVIGGDTLAEKKPAPEPLWHACQQLGVESRHALMVGDSKNDILAAQAAGISAVGLTYGYNYGEDITVSKPDYVFDKFKNILTLFEFSQSLRGTN